MVGVGEVEVEVEVEGEGEGVGLGVEGVTNATLLVSPLRALKPRQRQINVLPPLHLHFMLQKLLISHELAD